VARIGDSYPWRRRWAEAGGRRGHRRVPGVVRVQVVAAVERQVESVRAGRIAQGVLEVADPVEGATPLLKSLSAGVS
jgi:hypothetical protein